MSIPQAVSIAAVVSQVVTSALVGTRPLHVVVAYNAQDDEAIIITAYEPDAAQWDSTFKRRKR